MVTTTPIMMLGDKFDFGVSFNVPSSLMGSDITGSAMSSGAGNMAEVGSFLTTGFMGFGGVASVGSAMSSGAGFVVYQQVSLGLIWQYP